MTTATEPVAGDALRDPAVEAWLDSHHVVWEFGASFDLARIDVAASLANQARLEALDADVVDRYTAAIEAGEQMPPLLVHHRPKPRGKDQLVLLGGNHRYAALAANKRTCHPAYVVEAAPETATLLMYEDNRRHGFPPSDEERIAQALHLADQGYTVEEAARVVGVHKTKVYNARYAADTRRRAAHLGVQGVERLSKSAQARFATIKADPVFAETLKLVLSAGINSSEAGQLITRVNAARSEAAALEVIGTEVETRREEIQRTAGGKARADRNPRIMLLDGCTRIAGLNPIAVVDACANDDQRQLLEKRCLEVAKHLKAIHDCAKARR